MDQEDETGARKKNDKRLGTRTHKQGNQRVEEETKNKKEKKDDARTKDLDS